jgi:acetyl-CoA acyltransferase
VVAGGSESLSQVPVLHSRRMSEALVVGEQGQDARRRARSLATLRPKDFIPVTPAIAEPSTGETMGQSAEKMAKLNGVTREEQDAWALRSHRLAAQGWADGRLAEEVAPSSCPAPTAASRRRSTATTACAPTPRSSGSPSSRRCSTSATAA